MMQTTFQADFDAEYYIKNGICPLCDRKINKSGYFLGELEVHKICRQNYILWECIQEYGTKMLESNYAWRSVQIKRALEYDILHIKLMKRQQK